MRRANELNKYRSEREIGKKANILIKLMSFAMDLSRFFLRDQQRNEVEWFVSRHVMCAYMHRRTRYFPVSFLKRTCSHAIPYKKTDAVRNVPLETRYVYVRGTDSSVSHIYTCTYTRAITRAYRADRSVRTAGEVHNNSTRITRAAVLKK